MKKRTLFLPLIGLILLLGMQSLVAQTEASPLIIRSIGQLDQDGTALYSIFLISGEAAINELSARVTIPRWMTFQSTVLTPRMVEVTVYGDTITWFVEALPPDTVVGPLTYRVAANSPDGVIPAALGVNATWIGGEARFLRTRELVAPMFASTGSLDVDADGSLDDAGEPAAVPIGDTGIWIYVPADAVSEPTTLTFERLPVPRTTEERDVFPRAANRMWWSSVIGVTTEPAGVLSLPALLAIPSRRPVTPGLASSIFWRLADGEWRVMDGWSLFASPNGAHLLSDGVILADGMQIAYGVNDRERLTATVSGEALAALISDSASRTVQQFATQPTSDLLAALIAGR